MKNTDLFIFGGLGLIGYYLFKKNSLTQKKNSLTQAADTTATTATEQIINTSTKASRLNEYQAIAEKAAVSASSTYQVIPSGVNVIPETFSSSSKVYSGSIIGWTKDGRAIRA